jgi:7,8-dihydroneopterin aldolase/epimerase/oxygenase
MSLLALEGMRFHAFHGTYPAERILGTEFVVDIQVKVPNANKAAAKDDIALTLNYESVYQICQMEMQEPRNLIETVVTAIMERMKHQFEGMEALRVRVRKLNPPLGGRVDAAVIEMTEEYTGKCPRCDKKFISYNTGDCWERYPNLHTATREALQRQYRDKCLCDNCIREYAG